MPRGGGEGDAWAGAVGKALPALSLSLGCSAPSEKPELRFNLQSDEGRQGKEDNASEDGSIEGRQEEHPKLMMTATLMRRRGCRGTHNHKAGAAERGCHSGVSREGCFAALSHLAVASSKTRMGLAAGGAAAPVALLPFAEPAASGEDLGERVTAGRRRRPADALECAEGSEAPAPGLKRPAPKSACGESGSGEGPAPAEAPGAEAGKTLCGVRKGTDPPGLPNEKRGVKTDGLPPLDGDDDAMLVSTGDGLCGCGTCACSASLFLRPVADESAAGCLWPAPAAAWLRPGASVPRVSATVDVPLTPASWPDRTRAAADSTPGEKTNTGA